MPYAPGIQHRAGEFIAAGLDQGIGAIAGAIMERAQRRRQKEEWAKAAANLQPLIDQLAPGAGIRLDKDTPKEMVPQLIQIAGQLARDAREKPLRDLQVENEKLRQRISQQELDAAAKNAEALVAAAPFLAPSVAFPEALRADAPGKPAPMRPADYPRAMATYLGRGGTDPRVLAQIGELAHESLRASTRTPPGLQDFGQDAWGRPVQGLVDAQGNVSRIAPPTGAKDAATPFQIGDKTFYLVGSQILDGEGVPVKAPTTDKPLDPFAAQALYARYQDVLARAAAEPKAGFFESKEAAAQRTAQLRDEANFLARQLGYADPFPGGVVTAPASPAASAEKAPKGKPAAPPYTAADVQAELKRRGLAK